MVLVQKKRRGPDAARPTARFGPVAFGKHVTRNDFFQDWPTAPDAGTVAALYTTGVPSSHRPVRGRIQLSNPEEHTMIWETPAYVDIRLGFEVTMYVYNR